MREHACPLKQRRSIKKEAQAREVARGFVSHNRAETILDPVFRLRNKLGMDAMVSQEHVFGW
jgi:hypothetical protein